jgi:Autotransporter beta-domain
VSTHLNLMNRPAALFSVVCALAPTLGYAQTVVLPVLPGQSVLQTRIGTAVATMCVNALDNQPRNIVNAQVQDLHDQCHAIAGEVVTAAKGGPASPQAALGALQQVSGNEISTQGALATRAVSGQFANISGRLTALRFGAGQSLAQGHIASDSDDRGDTQIASLSAAQTGYRGQTMIPAADQSRDFAPAMARYVPQDSAFTRAGYFTDAPYLAQADSASGSHPAAMGAPSAPNPWGVYVQGSYTSGRHDATSNEDPFHFHASSVTGGIDYNFGSAVLGGSVGYDDYNASFNAAGTAVSGGSAEVKSTSGSLYAAWFGQNWTFNGIATYGHLKTDVSREVNYTATYDTSKFSDPQADIADSCAGTICTVSVNRSFQGDPGGHTIAVGATAGYQASVDAWTLMPSATASYRRTTIESFTETTAAGGSGQGLALNYADQTVESFRSIVGLDLSRAVSTSFGVVTPIVRVEWDHEFKTSARSILAHYSFDPTAATTCLSCFALPTDASPPNYGVGGAGLSVTLPGRLQAFVYDEVLFGFENYHANSVAIGVRGQF